MPRIPALHPDRADGDARSLLEGVRKKLGTAPNLMRTMAHSPAALESYLAFSGALKGGALSPRLQEQIALAVGQANGCDYCLAAHGALGRRAGLSEEEVLESRKASAGDCRTEIALRFARKLVDRRGWVAADDVARVREEGYTDGEIVEIVAHVALNLFTNYFNHVAETEVDFPQAPALERLGGM